MPAEAPAESPELVDSDPSDDVVDSLNPLLGVAEVGESVAVEEAVALGLEELGVSDVVLLITTTVVP